MEASGTAANREARPARILLPIPSYGFDPTEAAIPWKILSAHGHQVELTTPTGARGSADTIMLTGKGLGIWKKLLMARADAVAAYRQMEGSRAFQKPLAYDEVHPASFDAIFLPGGHDKGVREYLESEVLHEIVASFFALGKPVGAVCHGVLLAARSLEAPTGKSVIHDRTVTSLLRSQELL
ncbi:MAG TPA: hypothetical protein ENK19_05120, partial [Acidobacteria bacterium]|nr:hypothetical protein [Acidobacteriota bacterium]